MFAKDNLNTSYREAAIFIILLVIFAVISSSYVLFKGLQDPEKNIFRLVLHCVMIITSVVPPELPMELSLAVTNSLASLSRKLIFCTEPFRIAYAGRLDTICFDKTGTLTQDSLVFQGVSRPFRNDQTQVQNERNDDGVVIDPSLSSPLVLSILGSCHSLIFSGNSLTGIFIILTISVPK